VPNIYCDQNFLISIRDADEAYHRRLRELIDAGGARFVLSLWTLVEISKSTVPQKMVELAATADRITPSWLPERSHLHEHEIHSQFFRMFELLYNRPAVLRSLKEVAPETCGGSVPLGREYTALEFATLIRADSIPIDGMLSKNQAEWNSDPWPKSMAEVDRHLRPAVAAYIADLVPRMTPAGIMLPPTATTESLSRMALQAMPSVLTETALLRISRMRKLKRTDASFMDFQHGITALPYTDVFLTDDRKLRSLIESCRSLFQFPIAEVMAKAQFDLAFVP
jgi:hypothetical protein